MQSKIEAMKMKFERWIHRVENNIFEMFPNYSKVITDNQSEFDISHINSLIISHLQQLILKFEKYFPRNEINKSKLWIQDPFNNKDDTNLSSLDEDLLLELTNDLSLILIYKNKSLMQFWLHVRTEYPNLYNIALQILLPFASTYLCEKSFSTMLNIKTKQRNRLRINSCLRVALNSTIEARIDKLVERVQQQKFH